MARIANNNRTITTRALGYVENQIHQINRALQRADELDTELAGGNFTTANKNAFKTKLRDDAKTHNQNAVKMYRWLLDEMSIPTPTAYTDAEVDGIDKEIRTFDDGT